MFAFSEGASDPRTSMSASEGGSTTENQIPISEGDGSVNMPTNESEGGQFKPRQVTFEDPQIAEGAKHLDPNIDLIRRKQHRLFVLHELSSLLG